MDENIKLKHKPDLTGMVAGDFFYFCDTCGYQHKTGYVIRGKCPNNCERWMINCTATKLDITLRDKK